MHDFMAMEGTEEGRCSICLENTSDNCDRTIVRLRCFHVFHLDCIGSAFNATGVMQCPNCRQRENGIWRRFPYIDISDHLEGWTDDEEDEPLHYDPRLQVGHHHPAIFHRRARRVVPRQIRGPMDDPFVPIMRGECSTSDGLCRHPHPFVPDHSFDMIANLNPIRPEPSAPVDSLGHLFSLDQGGPSGRNGLICAKMQPFSSPTTSMAGCSSSVAAAIIASMAATGSSSNSFPVSLRDDFGWRRPYSKLVSPVVFASMASGSKLTMTCSEFHGNRTFTGSTSSSEQMMKDIFHAGARGSSFEPAAVDLVRRRLGGEGTLSEAEQLGDWFNEWLPAPPSPSADPAEFFLKREMATNSSLGEAGGDINNIPSISISSSDDEPEELPIDPAARSPMDTHDNRNAGAYNFDYLWDDMDPAYSSMYE